MTSDKRTLVANIPPFGLRMQPDLKARMEKAAKANGRSLNAEIVARLEGAPEPDARGEITLYLPPDLLERIDAYSSSVGTTPEAEIRETLAVAFPYVPTFAEYIAGIQEEIVWEDGVDPAERQFLDQAEEFLRDNPDLGKRRLDLHSRPSSAWSDE